MTSKPWEYLSRDEKLDYIRERLDSIDATLGGLERYIKEKLATPPPAPPMSAPPHGDDTH